MRRNIFVILGITALVVTAVVVLGPLMSRISPATPERANSIPLPGPDAGPDADIQPAPAPMLRVEVVDSVTGLHIEGGSTLDLLYADGALFDRVRGGVPGEAIEVAQARPGMVLCLRVRRDGYANTMRGPFTVPKESPLLLRCTLAPLYPVKFTFPALALEKEFSLNVFSAELPAWPETRPFSEVRTARLDGNLFMLPPGRYWVSTPDGLTQFDVTNGPLVVRPMPKPEAGELSISGVLTDTAGEPHSSIHLLAIRCGPGALHEVEARALTDSEGRFKFTTLRPGTYRVQETRQTAFDGEQAVWLGTVAADQATPDIQLVSGRLRPKPSTGSNRYGSVFARVLKHGKPVAGARLLIEGAGKSGAWADVQDGNYLGAATDNFGEVFVDAVPPQSYRVRVMQPNSLQRFEILVEPGKPTSMDIEIAPQGTAALTGRIRIEGTKVHSYWLDRVGAPNASAFGGGLELCGIEPGRYTLQVRDADGFSYEYPLEFKADETLTFEHDEQSAEVSGDLPYPGFWTDDAEIAYQDSFGSNPRNWSFSQYPKPEWEHGIDIKRLPRRKFTLVARAGYMGAISAIAHVDTSDGDVTSLDWVSLKLPDEVGGGLRVESASGPDHSPRTWMQLSLANERLAQTQAQRLLMMARDGKVGCLFRGLPPGTWTVTLEAAEYEKLTREVVIQAGKTTTLTIETIESVKQRDSHDRPLSGVKIRLPKSSTPPTPPPKPTDATEPAPLVPSVPMPPRPHPAPTDEVPEGNEVWLYPVGVSVDQLWCAVIHAGDGVHTWTTAVAERNELRVSLVNMNGRVAILVQGLPDGTVSLSLRLPDREPIAIELKSGQAAYSVAVE